MIRLIGILLFGINSLCAFGQVESMELVYQLEKEHHFIWTDNLQNLYVIHESGIESYPPSGEQRFKNSQLNLGEITAVDFNHSLKTRAVFWQHEHCCNSRQHAEHARQPCGGWANTV